MQLMLYTIYNEVTNIENDKDKQTLYMLCTNTYIVNTYHTK